MSDRVSAAGTNPRKAPGNDSALRTLRIDARFNGPPDSGNGGYVCGEIAKACASVWPEALARGVRVRLAQPPALETDLEITSQGDGCALFDGDTLVGEGWPSDLDLAVPDAVRVESATRAARAFRGYDEHVFPRCFVCGPERAEMDGLRIFPGPLVDGETSIANVFAAPWRPDPSLAAGDSDFVGSDFVGSDFVDPAFIWAALDCPGAFSFPQPDGAIVLLGEMTAAIPGRVRTDEASVLLSWQIEHSGRKHSTGSAIYDAAGVCQGRAHAIWIEIPAT